MFRVAATASRTTRNARLFSQSTRQFENNTGGIAGAAVKGIEKAGEVAQKVKEATGLGTGQAQGTANQVSGQASGKVNELAGKAEGKANELAGQAKGKAAELDGQAKAEAKARQ